MTEKSLTELDFDGLTGRDYFPSPRRWSDQVLYFLMLDRFSDGKEKGYRGNDGALVTAGQTKPYTAADNANAVGSQADAERWREAGASWNGGTLNGLTSKMGYLKRLGVTCVWVSPVFKQASGTSYHGYAIQNFLEVDPHFGSRDDLRRMVQTAHDHGIRVILDIILNHSGDVFDYEAVDPPWNGSQYPVKGFRDAEGKPSIPFGPVDLASPGKAWPDGAVWPAELQPLGTFMAKGRISNWDHDPEFREGDFWDLKDLRLGQGAVRGYAPSSALKALCDVYTFWIAYADVDGFRVDTVKHMDRGATRYFTSVVHEFAQSIGKDNFYLIGEITGGRHFAIRTLDTTGMDAALGINDIPGKLEAVVKGSCNPEEFFRLFRNSMLVEKDSHAWFRDRVVTVLDDHDQVRKGEQKARFCALDTNWPKMMLAALAMNVTTMGIPCVYYGSEQAFDGEGGNDRYLREAMFGGEFGAFRSRDRHCFSEDHPVYLELSKILRLRAEHTVLRRGRQYLRQISGDGSSFGWPHLVGSEMRSIVAWSRVLHKREMLLAINTDYAGARTAWVVVDHDMSPPDASAFECLYSTDSNQIGARLEVRSPKADVSAVHLTVPEAGFVVYGQAD